jgi:hypothetical protein
MRQTQHRRLHWWAAASGVPPGLSFRISYFLLKSILNHRPLSESGKSLAFCGKGAPGANPNSGLPPLLDRRTTLASARRD